MNSKNTAGGVDPNSANSPRNLTDNEKDYIQNKAVEIAENFTDLSERTSIIEGIRGNVSDVFDEMDMVNVMAAADEIYKRAVEIRMLENEEVKLEDRRQVLANQIHNEGGDQLIVGKFAKYMPSPTVNPSVSKDFWNGNFKRAASGLWHKLARAFHLKSPSDYDLKTKEEKIEKGKTSDQTDEMAVNIRDRQVEVVENYGRRVELLNNIQEISKRLDQLLTIKPAAKERIRNLKANLKEIGNQIEDIEDTMADYGKMLQLMLIEEDQAKGGTVDKAAGKLFTGFRKLIFANKNHIAYSQAFDKQASVETKLVDFEKLLKEEIGNTQAIDKNENVGSVYEETTILLDFEERQNHLKRRLELVKGLLEMATDKQENIIKKTDEDISVQKKSKLDNEEAVRAIRNNEKQWLRVGSSNIEKLFWHEFGERVTMIREWQADLPRVGRRGQVAFQGSTTSIFYEYLKLREDVKILESKSGMAGLVTIFDREFGAFENTPISWLAEKNRCVQELISIRNELELRKKRTYIAASVDGYNIFAYGVKVAHINGYDGVVRASTFSNTKSPATQTAPPIITPPPTTNVGGASGAPKANDAADAPSAGPAKAADIPAQPEVPKNPVSAGPAEKAEGGKQTVEQEKSQIIKDWLLEVFKLTDEKALPESEVSSLMEGFGSLDGKALKEKLNNENLKAVLQYFSTGSLRSVAEMPEIHRMKMGALYIYQMITFYVEEMLPEIAKGKSIDELLNEIQSLNIPLFCVPKKGRGPFGTKATAVGGGLYGKPHKIKKPNKRQRVIPLKNKKESV